MHLLKSPGKNKNMSKSHRFSLKPTGETKTVHFSKRKHGKQKYPEMAVVPFDFSLKPTRKRGPKTYPQPQETVQLQLGSRLCLLQRVHARLSHLKQEKRGDPAAEKAAETSGAGNVVETPEANKGENCIIPIGLSNYPGFPKWLWVSLGNEI